MKNNKYAPYILAPILVLVWGLIFYKIYQAVYGSEETPAVVPWQPLPTEPSADQSRSFSLLLDYRDPFLRDGSTARRTRSTRPSAAGTPAAANRSFQAPKKTPKAAAPVTPPATPFPTVIYQGFQVLEQDTIAALKINGQFYPLVHRGERLQAIQVLEIQRDSIWLLFEGRRRGVAKFGR